MLTTAFQSRYLTLHSCCSTRLTGLSLTRGSYPSQKRRGSEKSCLLFHVTAFPVVVTAPNCCTGKLVRFDLWSGLKLPTFLPPYFLCQPPQRACSLSTVCCKCFSLFVKTLVTYCFSSKIFHDLSITV